MRKPDKALTVEFRNLSEIEVRDSNDGQKIVGYAAVYGQKTEILPGWNEVIEPGAFDNVLATNPDTVATVNHDDTHVLGRTVSGTLKLSTDDKGLRYEITPPDTQVARDTVALLKRGDLRGASFGFVCGGHDSWTHDADGSDTRHIHGFEKLLDVSVVTRPAYEGASAQVRSLPQSMPVELRSRIETSTSAEEKRSDDEDGDEQQQCKCGCDECQNGDCEGCTNPDCDDPYCVRCSQQRSALHRKFMEMRFRALKTDAEVFYL